MRCCTIDLIDPDMKRRIDMFDEDLEERLDDTNVVDDVGDDFYIYDVDEANDVAHGDGYNTTSCEAYGVTMAEESPDEDNLYNMAYEEFIVSKVIMYMSGEGPSKATVRRRVEDLNGMKLGTYHWNMIMDT